MPASVRSEIGEIGLIETDDPSPVIEAAHVFSTSRAELTGELNRLRHAIAPYGFVWICWPKKESKVPTDITEDTIREVALPMD
jgi:hypothetical protein